MILSGGEWSSEDYLPLHSPQSSSISLQWTYRDGELVNLPQALLVEGDIIVVRPGRPVPGGACNVQVDVCISAQKTNFLVLYVPMTL